MSNAYKEVGTLKEIGARVGDVVTNSTDNCNFDVIEVQEGVRLAYKLRDLRDDGGIWVSGIFEDWRIVSRAQPGPVRTVTTTQIIPGKYGCVKVHDPGSKYVRINVDSAMDVEALTDAIATLTTIRDAMHADTIEK